MKKASGGPRKSSKHQDDLLELIVQQARGTTSVEFARVVGRCECICTHIEAKTFGGCPGVKKSSKEVTPLREKHQEQTDILQEVKGLD